VGVSLPEPPEGAIRQDEHYQGSIQHSRRQPQSSGSGRARVSSTVCVYPSGTAAWDNSRVPIGLFPMFRDSAG